MGHHKLAKVIITVTAKGKLQNLFLSFKRKVQRFFLKHCPALSKAPFIVQFVTTIELVLILAVQEFFLRQLIYFFEDEARAHLKTGMPMGHRRIIQNQTLIAVLVSLALIVGLGLFGLLVLLWASIPFFALYVLGVWLYFLALAAAHDGIARHTLNASAR